MSSHLGKLNFDVFIPIRLNSVRLPHKHLLELAGKSVLKHLIERLERANKIRKIIVCTTNSTSDDELIEYLNRENILYFRGDEKDILKRFLDAAHYFKTDVIIDVEGDKIYTDPFFVDQIVEEMENTDYDFVIGNDSKIKFNPANHFIHGFIPAGIRTTALEKICKFKKANNTETGYKEFFLIPNLFKTNFVVINTDSELSKNIRLTLDYKEDYDLAKIVFNELGNHFSFNDIIQLFKEKPQLLEITSELIRKWEENYKKNTVDLSLKSFVKDE